MKKTENLKEGTVNKPPQIPHTSKHDEIKPDEPLCEKDEVKQAEEKMRNVAKNKG